MSDRDSVKKRPVGDTNRPCLLSATSRTTGCAGRNAYAGREGAVRSVLHARRRSSCTHTHWRMPSPPHRAGAATGWWWRRRRRTGTLLLSLDALLAWVTTRRRRGPCLLGGVGKTPGGGGGGGGGQAPCCPWAKPCPDCERLAMPPCPSCMCKSGADMLLGPICAPGAEIPAGDMGGDMGRPPPGPTWARAGSARNGSMASAKTRRMEAAPVVIPGPACRRVTAACGRGPGSSSLTNFNAWSRRTDAAIKACTDRGCRSEQRTDQGRRTLMNGALPSFSEVRFHE